MKKNSKTPKAKTTDSERETRVLLEDVRQQVQIVAEGHGAIMRKLDEHGKKLDEHGKKLEDHDGKLNEISAVVQKIDIKVERIGQELETVKNAVMDMSDITKDHEKRIKKVEEKVFV